MGVDCSTTAVKAVVWNLRGEPVAQERHPFPLSQPRPGWAEQNAEDWWSAMKVAVRRAVQSVDASRIAAMCLTHQRETFVCLDESGQPLRPAMLWMDTRATLEVDAHGTEEVHRITGKPANPTPAWYKLHWLAANEPETLQRVGTVADVGGFLIGRLTGERVTSWASADPLGLVDLARFDYHDGLLSAVGLGRDQLPALAAPGTVIGVILDEVATELGLAPGLPVVAGAGDGQCAQLGTGITSPGRAYLNLGSGIVSGTCSLDYSHGRAYRTLAAPIPGAFTLETFMGGGTANLAWFVERFAGVDAGALGLDLSPEQILEAAAAQLAPGAEGLLALPYWTGALTPYWDHDARGVLFGLTGVHGKAHVYRALLEGIAFEQRFLTSGAEQALGVPVEDLIVLGGGSRSRLWCQIIADVMQRQVSVVQEPESTCLGAGMLAAAALGLHTSIEAAAESMSAGSASFTPDAATSTTYDRLYQVYRDLYPANRELFSRLAAAAEGY